MNVKNKVAVITGASSGIGRAIAQSLARRGCHLALADVNLPGLEQTRQLLSPTGVRVTTHPLDVTDREAVRALPAQVQQAHGSVDILVNNAGVALGGTFAQVSEADFDWLIDVNFGGVVRLTRAFLPYLQQRDEARIVNLSSVFGLIAPAGQSAYSASKFAVRGFSNALRHELIGTGIGVTVVHPGGVATAIARSARVPAGATDEEKRLKLAASEKLLRMPPERAGEIIVKGIETDRSRVLVGNDARLLSWLERLLPVTYWSILRMLSGARLA